MIIGVGTDILNLARLHAFPIHRLHRLSQRILTPKENLFLQHILSQSSSEQQPLVKFLGVRYIAPMFLNRSKLANVDIDRWAAKEALYKSLYPYHKSTWKNVEVLPKDWSPLPTGAVTSTKLHVHFTDPSFSLVNDFGSGVPRIHLSISHDEPFVVAMVVVEAS